MDLISGDRTGNSTPGISCKLDPNKQQCSDKDGEEMCWFGVKLKMQPRNQLKPVTIRPKH